MRYVVVIVALAFFVIYDGLYNQGVYLDQFVRWVVFALNQMGL